MPTSPLQGERRVATVILADVRSSTNLLETIGSEAWVEIMNRVFQILESEIYRFGGNVDQFRGDGLVAFFGATTVHEDDPERAVLAGLAMQQAIQPYAADLAAQKGIDLKLRIGVNTGEVIVATVGDSRQYREVTAMGEAVALAARMETAAEPGTVLVSEHTYQMIKARFNWQPLGQISVKGLSQPVAIYRPLGARTEAELAREIQILGISIPLTGRLAQKQILKHRMEDLLSGRGGIVLVSGDKGMGKSYLVSEVRQDFNRQGVKLAEAYGAPTFLPSQIDTAAGQTIQWLLGNCRSYNQTWPYSVWLDVFQSWLGIQRLDDHSEETARALLHQQLRSLWGDQADRYYPYLAVLLSLPLEDAYLERVKHLDADGLRRQSFLAVRSWVEAIAKQGPLVVIFSDMHWVDSSSIDLLRYCLPVCDNQPVLWLAIFRPDRTSPVWNFRHYVETEYPHRLTEVDLPPLTEKESRDLISQVIGPKALPEETLELVIQRTEGNPYYIQEIIRDLIDQGALARDPGNGAWHTTRFVTSLDMPNSMQSLLLARINRLSSEEKRVLQVAAVIGPVFWKNLLQAMTGEMENLAACLTGLQRAQLIQERIQLPDLEMEYAFTSSLIRDAVYESLLQNQRTTYHLEAAKILEEFYSDEITEQHHGLIAYHYRRAGNPNKELYYTLQAASQASKVYANAEAASQYTRALEILDKLAGEADSQDRLYAMKTQRFEVLMGRRRVFYLMGNMEAGNADSRTLLELARQISDDPIWLIDALQVQPEVNNPENREELRQGAEMAEEALRLAKKLGDRRREMYSLMSKASLGVLLRDPKALELALEALAITRELGDQRMEANLLLGIGSVYGMDNLERSKEYLEAALPLCQKLDDKQIEMSLLSALGEQLERSGDYYRQWMEYEEKRLRISQEIGDRIQEGHALMFCGQIQSLYLGDYPAGLERVEASLHLWESVSARLFPLLRIAQIQIMLGRCDEAQATLERARPVGAQILNHLGRAGLNLVTAIHYNNLGDESHLRQVLDLASQVEQMVAENLVSRQYQMAAACEATAAHLGLASLLARRETVDTERQFHLQQALETSKTALDIYNEFGFTQIIECSGEEILFRRSLVLSAMNDQAGAVEYLEQAYAEMMRKYHLIPAESPYCKTYLENIRLHQEIRAAHSARLLA